MKSEGGGVNGKTGESDISDFHVHGRRFSPCFPPLATPNLVHSWDPYTEDLCTLSSARFNGWGPLGLDRIGESS